eukprot:s119_g22.t1
MGAWKLRWSRSVWPQQAAGTAGLWDALYCSMAAELRYRLTFFDVEKPSADLRRRSNSCPAVMGKHLKLEDELAKLVYTSDLELRARDVIQNLAYQHAVGAAE